MSSHHPSTTPHANTSPKCYLQKCGEFLLNRSSHLAHRSCRCRYLDALPSHCNTVAPKHTNPYRSLSPSQPSSSRSTTRQQARSPERIRAGFLLSWYCCTDRQTDRQPVAVARLWNLVTSWNLGFELKSWCTRRDSCCRSGMCELFVCRAVRCDAMRCDVM